jgi:hypothetical protein
MPAPVTPSRSEELLSQLVLEEADDLDFGEEVDPDEDFDDLLDDDLADDDGYGEDDED